jgi:hypothetical protein
MGFLFVPGWTFLGATYDAVLVQPWVDVGIGTLPGLVPAPGTTSGAFNTYIVPVELSWKLGTSGFAVKTGLGIYAPTGTQTGANKLGNVGNPWWTFQPELIISYLANGWNLSAAIYEEFNTRNRVTHYTAVTLSTLTSLQPRRSESGRLALSAITSHRLPTTNVRPSRVQVREPLI